ncbi:ribosomal protein S18-alanine N-acetyltransferase [Abyssibacter profundi]|uniref:[Ribosomal protein bS18]-alanine N-acetyltransferase n=1 Tax=Abyssibacter profundi TaxID=2182787 RepID=A0A363UMD2_9GAMM|nr:ribosomal protein S18-alanine N-acetyltransferase [Abyssibacter profundi]PWN56582.1 ribosomal-protein-alanine N-acetyltransferase [Abyssibacter profundi]
MNAVASALSWTIRPMRPADVPRVAAIDQAAYRFPWTAGIFDDCLRVGYSSWVAQSASDRIDGYALMSMAAGEGHILNICVDPVVQRGGCGRQLVAHLLDIARAADLRIVFLEVRPTNAAALALYAGFGFDEIGRRPNYYPADQGREDAIMLAWEPAV